MVIGSLRKDALSVRGDVNALAYMISSGSNGSLLPYWRRNPSSIKPSTTVAAGTGGSREVLSTSLAFGRPGLIERRGTLPSLLSDLASTRTAAGCTGDGRLIAVGLLDGGLDLAGISG